MKTNLKKYFGDAQLDAFIAGPFVSFFVNAAGFILVGLLFLLLILFGV